MKKIMIFLVVFTSLLLISTPIQAKTIEIKFPIPSWFNQAIKPVQDQIKALSSKIDSIEAKIVELEKKITNNGNQNGEDFDLPQEWKVEFFQTMPGDVPVNGNDGCTEISCPLYPGTRIKISTDNGHCSWKGINIDSLVTTRIVGHLPKETYGIGTCKEMVLEHVSGLPESGKSFDVDIKLFWQGTRKEKKISVTIPPRPFPDIPTF